MYWQLVWNWVCNLYVEKCKRSWANSFQSLSQGIQRRWAIGGSRWRTFLVLIEWERVCKLLKDKIPTKRKIFLLWWLLPGFILHNSFDWLQFLSIVKYRFMLISYIKSYYKLVALWFSQIMTIFLYCCIICLFTIIYIVKDDQSQ